MEVMLFPYPLKISNYFQLIGKIARMLVISCGMGGLFQPYLFILPALSEAQKRTQVILTTSRNL
jgi:hypothetical protein